MDTNFIRRHFPLEPDWCALDKVSRGSVQETPGWLKGEKINIDHILYYCLPSKELPSCLTLVWLGLIGELWLAILDTTVTRYRSLASVSVLSVSNDRWSSLR